MAVKVFGVAGYTSHVLWDSSVGDVRPTGLVQGSDAIDVATGSYSVWIGAAWVPMSGVSTPPVYATLAAFAAVAPVVGLNGVTYECPILGSDGATEVGRGRWTCMPYNAVPNYGWMLVRCDMAGLDDLRPSCATLANGATFVGAKYTATDTLATYVCSVAGAWLVRTAFDCGDRAGFGPFATSCGHYAWPRFGPSPVGGIDSSTVVLFRSPAAVPGAAEYMFQNGQAPVLGAEGITPGRGTHICTGVGGGGTYSIPYIRLVGVSAPWDQLPSANYGAVLNSECGLAITIVWTGAAHQIRYSFNGGVVATVLSGAGAYTAPSTNVDAIAVGSQVAAGITLPFTGLIKAVWNSATPLSDAQLRVASAITTSRVPAQGQAVDFDWSAPRIPEGVRGYDCSGHTFFATRATTLVQPAYKWVY